MAEESTSEAKQSETRSDSTPRKQRRFTSRDFDLIAEMIVSEFERRKNATKRRDLEKDWAEIDRQVAMDPDVKYKKAKNGKIDPKLKWIPELELPLQAQTLEITVADARRMMFPNSGSWFEAHTALTDKYLERVDFQSLIAGDENEVPSQINQENADKLAEGYLNSFHRQYNFRGIWDLINTESAKYGTGVGRVRVVTREQYIDDAKGILKRSVKMPVLFPRSIKNTYLDDRGFNLLNEGYMLGPAQIFLERRNLDDMKMIAHSGKKEPSEMTGGWMPRNLSGIEGDKNGFVDVIEYEGDIIVPRSTTRSMFIPNCIVTVIKGAKGAKVARFRFRKYNFSSYVSVPYHVEDIGCPYGVGPLMKGRPIQSAASLMLCFLSASGILNVQPPVRYDRTDAVFETHGGPLIEPRALWGTLAEAAPVPIGDPAALLQIYTELIRQYYDVTGANAARLGAQTKSHTTGFAKEVEMNRGTIRVVDYVQSILDDPMNQVLSMEFEMGKDSMGGRTDLIYLDSYRAYVEIKKEHLADDANFDVYGAGGPQEVRAKFEQKFTAMQTALQLDAYKARTGSGEKPMNIQAIQEQLLREGGWIDIDQFFQSGTATAEDQSSLGLLTEPGREFR